VGFSEVRMSQNRSLDVEWCLPQVGLPAKSWRYRRQPSIVFPTQGAAECIMGDETYKRRVIICAWWRGQAAADVRAQAPPTLVGRTHQLQSASATTGKLHFCANTAPCRPEKMPRQLASTMARCFPSRALSSSPKTCSGVPCTNWYDAKNKPSLLLTMAGARGP
jgi:hypothetical protein